MAMPLIKPSLVTTDRTISSRREIFTSQTESVSTNALKMIRQNNATDVVIVCNDGGEFPAHKFILSVFSSYFFTMFNGSFVESSCDRIVMHSINTDTMRFILEYMDLNFADHQAFEESIRPIVADVFLAAHMLDISGLIQLSCTILGENITHENYTQIWALYDLCKTETLKDHLCASFRHHYQHFLVESVFLEFDPSLMKFIFGNWAPFINHKWLMKMMFQWIKHDPKHREDCLAELAKMLRKERIPSGYIHHLAQQDELLRKHPEVIEQFAAPEQTILDTTEFEAEVGDKIIADSVSMIVFEIHFVRRLYFSGRIETKVMPFNLLLRSNARACVQYKKKLYLIGKLFDIDQTDFFEYDFDDNSIVSMGSTPIPASKYCDVFVVDDRMYLQCSDSDGDCFVQCYDFCIGEWTGMLDLPDVSSLCPYEHSLLVLQPAPKVNPLLEPAAIEVTSLETMSFTIPIMYHDGFFFHYNKQLWGFLCIDKTFVYEMDKKCLKKIKKIKSWRGTLEKKQIFQRISSMQHHPLIVKKERFTFTLLDLEYGVELAVLKDIQLADWMLYAPYCTDPTL